MTRRHTRFRLQGKMPEGVTATLMDRGRPTHPTLIDISISGVALLVRDIDEPAETLLARWGKVGNLLLVLDGPRLGRPLEIDVRAVHGREMPQGLLVGARLLPGVENQPFVEAAIERLFNRRSAARASPAVGHTVQVTLPVRPGRKPIIGELRDLSMAGAAVVLSAEDGEVLSLGDQRRMSFALTDDGDTLSLGFTVRRLELTAREGLVGLEFDEKDTQQPHIAQLLCRWVTERQIESRAMAREQELEARRERVQSA